MKARRLPMTYETPLDHDILQAYINKNISYKRADIRKLRRALRKLAY